MFIICQKCKSHNPVSRKLCRVCGHSVFLKDKYHLQHKIYKNTDFGIIENNSGGIYERKIRIWQNNHPQHSALFINSPDEWRELKAMVDIVCQDQLQWPTSETLPQTNSNAYGENNEKIDERFDDIFGKLQAFDREVNSSEDSIYTLSKMVDLCIKLITNNQSFDQNIAVNVLTRIAEASTEEARSLNSILQRWNVAAITRTIESIDNKLATIEIFDKMAAGPSDIWESKIHKLLKNNIWILDENLTVKASERSLKNLVEKYGPTESALKLDKDKKGMNRRIDLLGATRNQNYFIIELKRPGLALTLNHLDQLENYLIRVEKFARDISNPQGILIGHSLGDGTLERAKMRKGIRVLTYADVCSNASERYRVYKSELEKSLELIEEA